MSLRAACRARSNPVLLHFARNDRPRRVSMKRIATVLAAGFLFALPASAQPYPNKPVRFISAFSPGGGSEIALRILAQKLTESGWPSAVVENRPGGGGVVAAMAAKS